MTRVLLLPFFLLALCANGQTLSITHARVIDTITGQIRPDTTVVIDGNRIARVDPSSRSVPKTAKIINAHGQYLIPGLWDMHTHVYFDRTAADGDDLILPLFIANGITGIRDMGSELDAVLNARDRVASHRLFGPRMMVSGPMLDGPKSQYKAAIPI
ncbi:MAG TPA: amidohydrolase family protein, partial [Acidobacteriaceae bacterium]|nr:amidohydrolase family protein [Acidobacteriaceae bacterium]